MKKKILVPLDGSKLAEMALPHAIALAQANDYTIVLLRVAPQVVFVNSISWAFAPRATVFEGWEEEVKAEAEYLNEVAANVRAQGVTAETKLLEDDPASAIVAYAERHTDTALIVMSTHGRSGLSRWIFGSVAEKVLHGAPVPLLLVRSSEKDLLPTTLEIPAYKSLLLPLDGSVLAAQALDQAMDLAKAFGATITLMTAIPETPPYTEVIAPPVLPAEWEDEADRMVSYLEQTAKRLQDEGYQVKTHLEYGAPAEAILRVADVIHADLIVMATHGRSGIPRLWLGSVAMKVVQAASRPVLMIRPTQPATHPEAVEEPEAVTV